MVAVQRGGEGQGDGGHYREEGLEGRGDDEVGHRSCGDIGGDLPREERGSWPERPRLLRWVQNVHGAKALGSSWVKRRPRSALQGRLPPKALRTLSLLGQRSARLRCAPPAHGSIVPHDTIMVW